MFYDLTFQISRTEDIITLPSNDKKRIEEKLFKINNTIFSLHLSRKIQWLSYQ